jgi:hypothetical protein
MITLYDHIQQLRAELRGCYFTRRERAAVQAELGRAIAEQAELDHAFDAALARGAVESHRGDRGRRVSGPFPLPTNGYGVLAPFTGEPLDRKLIETNWDNVQRVITAFRNRVVAPSLILRKLGTTLRQSALSLAMREIARIERTVHNLDWIEDKGLRADTTDVLNKGEARHTLSRATFAGRAGGSG